MSNKAPSALAAATAAIRPTISRVLSNTSGNTCSMVIPAPSLQKQSNALYHDNTQHGNRTLPFVDAATPPWSHIASDLQYAASLTSSTQHCRFGSLAKGITMSNATMTPTSLMLLLLKTRSSALPQRAFQYWAVIRSQSVRPGRLIPTSNACQCTHHAPSHTAQQNKHKISTTVTLS